MNCSTPGLCPSPTPGSYSNSCPLSQWCHPTISSSVVPFSSHLQSFPASESSSMSQLFASGGQSIGVSASVSVFPMNIQDWVPLWWTGWISLLSKGLSRVFSSAPSSKASVIWFSVFFMIQLSHPYKTTRKIIALTTQNFFGKAMSLLFKNWYLWPVVLDKNLESPLDGKEIKLYNSKENQSWMFTGSTDAEAPILWPPDVTNWLIWKDPDPGKDWRQE